MDENLNFATYLFLSSKKFIISVNNDIHEKIYEKELILDKKIEDLDLNLLDLFLSENVFKIEKILNSFIKNIYVIIDCNYFFSIKMSIKKNNYGDLITTKNLNYILKEARDQCSDTLKDMRIIHVLIDNYVIDNQEYDNFPQNLNCNHFSLDIDFICLPLNYLKNLENIINKYQISLNRLINKRYMEDHFLDEKMQLTEMAKKIIDGHNLNEVVLTSKKLKNDTFFEKFFHFFR